ncbi:MAG: hypothetical protein E7342_02060 [Clostridiales bacterium]|nr:hypothetical protein [Clostridiales bacterium]
MKRAIVVSVRQSKDSKTNEDQVWLTMAIMPTKMSNGNLYYPKSTSVCVSTVGGALKSPDKFSKYKNLKIGDVVNVDYALNEFTQKPFIMDVSLVKESAYKESDLIV